MKKALLSILGFIVAVVLIGLIAAGVYFASTFDVWTGVRDWVLIVLAFFLVLFMATTAIMMLMLYKLAMTIKNEVMPVIEGFKSTTSAVGETTKFANKFAIAPGIKLASMVLGAQQAAKFMFGKGKARERAERREKRRRETAGSKE